MDRSIAVVTHELSPEQGESLHRGLERFNQLMEESGLEVVCADIGSLHDNTSSEDASYDDFPTLDGSGHYQYGPLEGFIPFNVKLSPNYRGALSSHTDVLLAVGNLIVQEGARQWHTRGRNGEAYGLGDSSLAPNGSYGGVGLHPVSALEGSDRDRFVDYIVRHELGHMLGGFHDLPEDAPDDIMKPLVNATPEHLQSKVTVYSPTQVAELRQNLERLNTTSIFAYREWAAQQPVREISFRKLAGA